MVSSTLWVAIAIYFLFLAKLAINGGYYDDIAAVINFNTHHGKHETIRQSSYTIVRSDRGYSLVAK
ncbi:hypothetical protein ACKFKG_08470 [Phormidesmis sp. 146-35]